VKVGIRLAFGIDLTHSDKRMPINERLTGAGRAAPPAARYNPLTMSAIPSPASVGLLTT
jgi:hypothetical protein